MREMKFPISIEIFHNWLSIFCRKTGKGGHYLQHSRNSRNVSFKMADFTLSGEDRDMLRAYVTGTPPFLPTLLIVSALISNPSTLPCLSLTAAKDHEQYNLLPQDIVSVHVTHCNLPQKLLDLRFDKHTTVRKLIGSFVAIQLNGILFSTCILSLYYFR